MSSSADESLLATLGAVAGAFRELGAPAMIIGGVAVIARGIPRQTVDVDGTVWAEALDLDRLFETLARHGLTPRIADGREFARQRQILLLRHEPTGTPVGDIAAVLDEPARLAEFEAIVRRVREATGEEPR